MGTFIMQYKYRYRYLVVIDGDMYVYKYEKCKFNQPFISFQPKDIFMGKSKVCAMTEFSGAADNSSDFDGNTLLLQCENNEYAYISGLEIFKIRTDDKIKDYISLMGNNMIHYAIIIGEKYRYFSYNRYNFLKNDKIEERILLNATNNSSEPYDYHVENCVKDAFKKLEHTQMHTCWPVLERRMKLKRMRMKRLLIYMN